MAAVLTVLAVLVLAMLALFLLGLAKGVIRFEIRGAPVDDESDRAGA